MNKQGIDVAAMTQTAVKVVTSPAAFFREMPKTGGFVGPLVFMMIMASVTAIVNAVLGLAGLKFVLSTGMAIAGVIILPLIAAVAGFIGAAILFVIWKLMGSQEPYETSYRCTAYLSALMPVMAIIVIIPYVGLLLMIAGWTWLYVIASVETHKIEAQRAWLVFGILGAAALLIGIGAGFASRALQNTSEQRLKEMQKTNESMRKAMEDMQKRMPKQ